MNRLELHAQRLDEAARTARAVPQLTHGDPDLTVEEAYAVQAISIQRRLDRGERRIGMKMGLTSRAKMIQVGVDQMTWGRLTNAMLIEEGGSLSRKRFVHPRVEPEIAFLMKHELRGEVTAAQAIAAVEAVAPAMEIIDSRYENFKFTLADVVADNSSSSAFVVGAWHNPRQDLANLGVLLAIDGIDTEIGSTAAILGHPLRSLVAAARMVAESDEALCAGDIVMAGGITAAPNLKPGMTVRNEVQNIGAVTFHVEE
nr:fumarylacetoacetate hydrolase family protein [Sphingomonas sp. CDS-1]